MKDKPSLFVQPDFYGVYVLQLRPKPRSFYIGSTPDPVRRLKQHNTQTSGGAYRTKKVDKQPWDMVILCHGFPSHVSALQFEHALQHPYQTRHIREKISKTKLGANSIHHKLGNIRLLLNSVFFAKMDLSILIFNDDTYHNWKLNKFGVDVDNKVQLTNFNHFFNLKLEKSLFNQAKNYLISKSVVKCEICQVDFEFIPNLECDRLTKDLLDSILIHNVVPLIAFCDHCSSCFHLTCLALKFTSDLIPSIWNSCPNCNAKLNWPSLSKLATQLRAYILQDFVHLKLSQSN